MKKVKLGEICSIKSFKRIFETEYVNQGIPFIRGQEISDGSIDKYMTNYKCYISHQRFEEIKNRYGIPNVNDILITAVGTIGNLFLINNNYPRYYKDGNILWLTDFRCDVLPKYLFYYMQSIYFKRQLDYLLIGAVQKALTIIMMNDITVLLPNLNIQHEIVTILDYITKKIKTNKAINDNLMQMASTVFMHYFFMRTPNGKLGSIIIEHAKSKIQVSEAQNASGNIPFFTSGDSILKCDTALVDDRCCYLNTGGNADVKFYVGKAAYSTDTWCISGKDDLSDYLYLLLHAIKPELDKKYFQGTGLKHLQKPLLKDRSIYIPTTQELNAFNAQIKPMLTKISDNIRENQRLMSIRDWLLPLLMNGQATVEA